MAEDLDPEIAALLGNGAVTDVTPDAGTEPFPAQDDPFAALSDSSSEKKQDAGHKGSGSIHNVDLSITGFAPLEKLVNDTPSDVYNDTKYYKTVLTGENQSAQRVHQVLSKYLTCQDPKDRAVYRQQIVTAYWELLRGMLAKAGDVNLPMPKRMFMRFGVLLPSLFKQETKEFFSKVIFENKYNEPVLYLDEWMKEIASGRMGNSATDEKRQPVKAANLTPEQQASAEQSRLMQLQSKNSGKLQSSENILNIKENERSMLEIDLKSKIDEITDHASIMGMEPHKESLTDMQRRMFSEITDILRRLSKNDKELAKALGEYREAKATFDNVQDKMAANGGAAVVSNDSEAVKIEFETVRQMAKMTVGRRGNQFPLFTREFFHCTERGTGTRENVIEVLRWIESLDPGVFHRIHKIFQTELYLMFFLFLLMETEVSAGNRLIAIIV